VEPFDPRSIKEQVPTVLDALSAGHPEAALVAIDQLVAAGKAPAGIEYYRGVAYVAMDRTEDALRAFLAELEVNPGNGLAHGLAADALIELGRVEEAQGHIESGRALATDFPYLVLVAGRAAMLSGDAPLARNAFETYLVADTWSPLAAEAHYALSQLALEREDADAARRHMELSDRLERIHQYLNRYRERLVEDPGDTTAALGVAKVFLDLFRSVDPDPRFLVDAEGGLQTVLAIEPGNVAALFNMGFLRMVQGRHEEALEFYAAAAAGDPSHVGTRLNAGMLLREMGRPGDALPLLTQASQLAESAKDRERSLYERGRCQEELDLPGPAAESYRELLALPPQGTWDAEARLKQLDG
jgi:tetratricopeptide (TPR) repeat protein